MYLSLSLFLSLCIHIYIYIYIHVYINPPWNPPELRERRWGALPQAARLQTYAIIISIITIIII